MVYLTDLINNILFSGLTIFASILIVILSNTIKPINKRISKEVMKKSNLIASGISFGIWLVQIVILGIIFGFFVHMVLHVILIVIFLIVHKLFVNKYLKEIVEESVKKSLGLEKNQEALKLKDVQTKQNENPDVLLDVQDLVTYFYTEEGIVKAVEGVSFQIFKNEVLGLVGETGCGKSVTALSILKLIRPPGEIKSGKVLFNGVDLAQKTSKEMENFRGDEITMIFQDPLNSLNPVMKVGDQIIEVYLIHKEDELYAETGKFISEIQQIESEKDTLKIKIGQINQEIKEFKNQIKGKIDGMADGRVRDRIQNKETELKPHLNRINELNAKLGELKDKSNIFWTARQWAKEMIQEVGIADAEGILDRYPHELSGGMRQRIMIAIGLACSPKLLIADEPTTALDVTIQAQILQLMKELQKNYKTSILMITHDLGLISELCDRVAVMYSGYIVEYGSIYKLFKEPLHPYTHGLLRAIPRVEKRTKRLEIIPGLVPNLIYPPSGCRFHPRCKYCFEPCKTINPKSIEIEPGYFVACHLYNPKYKELSQRALEKGKKEIEFQKEAQ
ncbi:MAG: oligopeptide/dipeptide ABC transporter ATP-binding protein [Promethearchaeota archaeon]